MECSAFKSRLQTLKTPFTNWNYLLKRKSFQSLWKVRDPDKKFAYFFYALFLSSSTSQIFLIFILKKPVNFCAIDIMIVLLDKKATSICVTQITHCFLQSHNRQRLWSLKPISEISFDLFSHLNQFPLEILLLPPYSLFSFVLWRLRLPMRRPKWK